MSKKIHTRGCKKTLRTADFNETLMDKSLTGMPLFHLYGSYAISVRLNKHLFPQIMLQKVVEILTFFSVPWKLGKQDSNIQKRHSLAQNKYTLLKCDRWEISSQFKPELHFNLDAFKGCSSKQGFTFCCFINIVLCVLL